MKIEDVEFDTVVEILEQADEIPKRIMFCEARHVFHGNEVWRAFSDEASKLAD